MVNVLKNAGERLSKAGRVVKGIPERVAQTVASYSAPIRVAALVALVGGNAGCMTEFPPRKGACDTVGQGTTAGCADESEVCRQNMEAPNDPSDLACYDRVKYCEYTVENNINDVACPQTDALPNEEDSARDGETPAPDAGSDTGVILDSSVRADVAVADAALPNSDAVTPHPDATRPTPDSAITPRDAMPIPGDGNQLPADAAQTLDAAQPSPDAAELPPDAAVPTPDAAQADPDAGVLADATVLPRDAAQADPDSALILDAIVVVPPVDASVDATPDAAPPDALSPDAAPIHPCVIRLTDVIRHGAATETLQIFCPPGVEDHQQDLVENRTVFGLGNLCGSDGATAILIDRTQEAIFNAIGDDCGLIRVDFGPRSEVPTEGGPLNNNWIRSFNNNGELTVNGADIAEGDGVVRFERR